MDVPATEIMRQKRAMLGPTATTVSAQMNAAPPAPAPAPAPVKIMPALPTGPSPAQHFRNSLAEIASGVSNWNNAPPLSQRMSMRG